MEKQLNTNKTGIFEHGELKIYWEKFGQGPHHLVAFHGYGLRSNSFDFLKEVIDLEQFTVVIPGLFQHESLFPPDRIPNQPLQPEELKSLMQAFLAYHAISRFGLIGYSIGARLCFQLVLQMPDRLTGLVVAAPDGIVRNRWYAFLMSSRTLGRIYLFFLQQGWISKAILTILKFVRLLDEESLEIATAQVENKKRAQRVYDTWSIYKLLFPSPEKWIEQINRTDLPVRFYFGKQDELIGKRAIRKIKLLAGEENVIEINDGHMLLKKQYAEEFYQKDFKRFRFK